ncbi:MAG: glycosyltransferase family 39 protein [Bacteroidota bacterium]|nr:glycosyltransferase family 39 protein [Bacteroidota bacterium]
MKRFFEKYPLVVLIFFGLGLRVAASFFSKGFLTLDDHHNLVIDADLLASGLSLSADFKDSALYPFIVSLIMQIVRLFGINAPDTEMLFVRLLHGLFSVIGIYLVFKILEAKVDKRSAAIGGLFMSAFFVMPIFSVHQFEEVICQVPLLASVWYLVRFEKENKNLYLFLSGLFIGVALILRFPLISFAAPFLLGVIINKSSRKLSYLFLIGFLVIIFLQSLSNLYVNGEFGYSFSKNYGFILSDYNSIIKSDGYPAGPPSRYLLTLLAAFIPPFSILFLIAAVRGSRTFILIGLSTLAFLIAHSVIENKQERFLLPIIPMLIILGVAGFNSMKLWFQKKNLSKIYKYNWVYFWVLNSILLVFFIFHYGKKDRIEPLVYISEQQDATGVLIAQFSYTFLVPDYYLGKTIPFDIIDDKKKLQQQEKIINYCVLYTDSLEQDKNDLEKIMERKFVLEKTIEPSIGDLIAHKLNPKYNKSRTCYVFKIY